MMKYNKKMVKRFFLVLDKGEDIVEVLTQFAMEQKK